MSISLTFADSDGDEEYSLTDIGKRRGNCKRFEVEEDGPPEYMMIDAIGDLDRVARVIALTIKPRGFSEAIKLGLVD